MYKVQLRGGGWVGGSPCIFTHPLWSKKAISNGCATSPAVRNPLLDLRLYDLSQILPDRWRVDCVLKTLEGTCSRKSWQPPERTERAKRHCCRHREHTSPADSIAAHSPTPTVDLSMDTRHHPAAVSLHSCQPTSSSSSSSLLVLSTLILYYLTTVL